MRNLEETILVKNAGHIDAGMHGACFLTAIPIGRRMPAYRH
jgi:hypothetical protein